jgi:hypothetical protein
MPQIIIHPKIYVDRENKYFYEKYNNMLPLESSTLEFINESEIARIKNDGYRYYPININTLPYNVYAKEIIEIN